MLEELTTGNWITLIGYGLTLLIVLLSYHFGKRQVNKYQKNQDIFKRKEEIRKVIVNFHNREFMFMNKLRFDSVKPKITIDEVNARNDLSFILKLHLKDEILHEFNNILKPYFLLTSNYGNPDFDFNKEKMIEIAKALTNTTSNLIDFIKKTDLLFE